MKASIFYPFLILILFPGLNTTLAQETEEKPLSIDSSPIEGQFQYVYQKSSTFEDYKMVKTWHYARLKSHVLDTLKMKEAMIADARNEIKTKGIKIDSLVTAIEQTHVNLDKALKERDSFSFLGMSIQKAGYNSMVWSVIGLLTAALLIFLFLYRRSFVTISHTKSDLDEIKTEFETFRKRALEREEGIVRKYHNELMLYKSKVNK
jgi:hypothetical protein